LAIGREHAGPRQEPRNRRALAEGTERETGRLEAFSDGIFAFAITLLIVDVRLPQSEGNGHLLRSLLALWPSYFALVFSFVMIGIYWSQHHCLQTLPEHRSPF
jgi:uncharacterized membrane protein